MCDEAMLESYLETGYIHLSQIKNAVRERKIFPCFFGSALKLQGIDQFLQGIVHYAAIPSYPEEFGARIFKISRDEQGNRLTHLKITGGSLKVKDLLTNGTWEEKVNQIRIYSGEKYELVNEIAAGFVCAVTGLSQTKPGEGLGIEEGLKTSALEPVLSYQIILPEDCAPMEILPKLRQLEDEEPELHIIWDEQLQEIQAQLMGEIQIEILQSLMQSRFGIDVQFNIGKILYKETIANIVEGVGHFEPLGHYAEVHLLLEPGAPGSGLQFAVECNEDLLAKNWQRLVLSHLEEKTHKGVLTGSPITDMKITLVSGRTHNNHTEGGDFREATYRAVRQGLREAESILLEPYYSFQLELPEQMIGRAMADIDRMHGSCEISETNGEMAVLAGTSPVITMRNYHREVVAYTRGRGRLSCYMSGYQPCHNADEVIADIGYDSERDLNEPTGSIFCAHGAGFSVSWDQVKQYMHLESYLQNRSASSKKSNLNQASSSRKKATDIDEIDYDLLNQAVNANKGKKFSWNKRKEVIEKPDENLVTIRSNHEPKDEYLLVDGYNIIHAWSELQELAKDNMDAARITLLNTLCSYQGVKKCQVIVVFDAYRVPGHLEEISDYHNIKVVFTKEAQTADEFIERFAYEHQKEYNITVATSDNLQQIIIRGAGSALLSARDLRTEVELAREKIHQINQKGQGVTRNFLGDSVVPESLESLRDNVKDT